MADIFGTEAAETLNGTATDDRIYGLGGNDKLYGKNGNDQLFGGAGNDSLNGNAGADIAFGGSGDDTYYVDDIGDILSEETVAGVDDGGSDRVYSTISYTLGAFFEKLTLTGSAAVNATGNNLANVLTGNSGANVLTGGGGKDTLKGGAGADTFMFGPADATSTDKVEDFATEDWVGIRASDYGLSVGSGLVINGSGTPVLDAAYFVTVSGSSTQGTASGHGQFVYNTTTRTLMWDANGAGGAAGVALATFNSGTVLSAADFAITVVAPPLPVLSIAATNASQSEGNTGTTAFTFTITRTGDTSGTSSVNYTVTGGVDADDFGGVLPSGTETFTAGETTRVVTLNVSGDSTFEPDEAFTVTLASPTGATIGTASASGTILNDDAPPPPVLSIAATNASQSEGNTGTTAFTFTITRTGDTSGTSSVNYTVTGGVDADDFGGVLPSGTETFTAGETTRVVTLNVSGDSTFEPDEAFTVTLASPTGATIGTASASGTILNDDAPPPPVLSIAATNASQSEGNTGTTAFTFTITRTGDTSGTSSVNYTVTGGVDADDFGGVLPSGTETFTAGETTRVVTLNVSGDSTFEPDEAFTVTLASPTGATIGTASASGTILNDDAPPPPVLSIAATNASQSEGNTGTTAFTFTITRTGDTSGTSSVNYTVTGGVDADDFGGVLPSGTETFTAGETTRVVTLNVSGDSTFEPDEAFTVTLASPTGATIGTASASGTILNDDAPPPPVLSIAATNASQSEGNTGTTAFTFTITRTGDTSGTSSVNYTVTGGVDADDFGGVLPSGTETFTAGETTRVVTLNVSGDSTFEPDEAFTVTLASPTGATIGTASASGTILNDDAPPPPVLSIAATNASQSEGNTGTTAFTFTITRTGDTSGTSSVNYTVTGGVDADDFGGVLPSGTETFTAGETTRVVTLNVSGDSTFEPDEAFTVTLASPTGATIGTASASGTILNDDAPPPPVLSIAATNASQSEGNTGTTAFTFTITRTGDTSGTSSVNYTVTGGVDADDFGGVLPSGTETFTAGETTRVVTLNVSGDSTFEPDEAFTVTLASPTGATIGTASASGTILNDDAPPPPVLSIAATNASQSEGNTGTTAFTFTITRTGDTSGTSSVNYTVTGGVDADDFGGVLPSGTETFTAGETTRVVTLNVSGDSTFEPDEAFTVTLASPTGATIGTASASGTILNDDAPPPPVLSIAATNASQSEGNTGTTAFTFTITRTGDTSGTSSVNYTVTGGVDADDFGGVLPSGTETFTAGETTRVVTLNVSGDSTFEPDEAFTVTLASPTGATIGTASASGTILNDDAPPPPVLSIAATNASQSEGNTGTTAFTFTITRTGDTSGTSSVNYTVTGGVDADDFGGVLPSGTETFTAGETTRVVTLNVSGDSTFEPDEAFTVTLASPTGATIGTASASGTILNDDAPPPPVLSIAATNASQSEGNTGTTAFTFTITRTGDTSGTSSVNYTVTGGVDADDFGGVLPSGTETFTAGETTRVVTLNVSGDSTFEPDEAFTVTLASPTGATIGTASASGTILNDDAPPPPVLSIAATNASQSEGNTGTTAFTFTITRTGDTSGTSSVNYTVTGGVDADDFGGVLPSGTETFTAGETTRVVTLNVSGDSTFEPDEAFTVTLASPTGATIGTASASGTILNDDAPPPPVLSIAATNASQSEGNTGTTAFTFTITRTGDTSGTSSVNYTVTGGVDADDFGGVLPSGTETFTAGETTRVVTLNVSGDSTFEPDEAFTVTLASPTGATIGTASASGTILNDDAAPVVGDISIDDVTLSEGDAGATIATFTVSRTGTAAFSVDYATANGTATAGTDYVANSGLLSFAAGEASRTLSVTLNGDTTFEPDETFFVDLTNATNGGTIVVPQGVGTISNDEPLPTVAVANGTPNPQNELGTAKISFIISLSALASEAVLVTYNTVSGSGLTGAAAGFDFTGASGTATIAANTLSTTVLVDVLGDNTHEQTENFTLQLGTAQLSPSGTALAITDNSGTGSILDNDLAPTVSVAANGIPNPQTEGTVANISFRITLSRPASQNTLVTYSTVNGTAVAGSDFTGITTATAIIAAGTTSTDVFVTLLNDTMHELSEAFTLRLDAAQLATTGTVLTITGSPGTGNITDNDPLPTVVVANGTPNPQLEGTGAQIGFVVTLSNAASQDVTLNYSTVNGTALAGSDFTGATNQTATIAAGSTSTTIFVNLINNSVLESTEAFTLQLNSAQLASGTVLTINDNSGTGTIADDEAGPSVVAQYSLGPIGSTDPAGLAYIPATGTLYLADSEVDESPFNNPINLFALETDGTLINSFNLTASVTDEPTGLAFNPVTGFMYITDDDQFKVFWVDPANPTVKVGEFVFGSSSTSDPEDIAVDPSNGNLFIVNGLQRTIVETTYTGTILNTVTLPSVIYDPEALAYDAVHDVFYVGVGGQNLIWKVDRNGTILATLDIFDDYRNPVSGTKVHVKDMEFAPSSNPNDDPSKLSLYVADYGNSHVDDGRLFEVDLGNQAPLDFLV